MYTTKTLHSPKEILKIINEFVRKKSINQSINRLRNISVNESVCKMHDKILIQRIIATIVLPVYG